MLRNIRIGYDTDEDRLVLGLVVGDAEAPQQHWLHLTRRTWAQARHDLQAVLDLSADLPERLDPAERRSLSAAHHQAVAALAPTRTEPAELPGPDVQPVLVLGLRCGRRRSDRRWVLSFRLRDKPELSLLLTDPTVHALARALLKREALTGWGLPPLAAASEQPAGKPAALH